MVRAKCAEEVLDILDSKRSNQELQREVDALLSLIVSGTMPDGMLARAKKRAACLSKRILRRQGLKA